MVYQRSQSSDLTLVLRVRKAPNSNLSQETGYPDRFFRGFPQSLHANAESTPNFGHERYLPSLFQLIIH
jgi:hypothetical protein